MVIRTIALLFMAATVSAYAATPKSVPSYEITGSVKVESPKKTVESAGKIVIRRDETTWQAPAPAKDGVTLLGRIVSSTTKTITLEFLVIDTGHARVVLEQRMATAKVDQPDIDGLADGFGKALVDPPLSVNVGFKVNRVK